MAKIDLGKKESFGGCCEPVEVKGKKKVKIFYPSFYVNKEGITVDPKLVGKTFSVVAELKLRRHEVVTSDGKPKREDMSFDVHSIDFKGAVPKKKSDSNDKIQAELEEGLSES